MLLSVALVDEVGPTYRLEGAALLDGCLLSSGGKEVCTWKIMYVYISLQSLVHRDIFFKCECNNIL